MLSDKEEILKYREERQAIREEFKLLRSEIRRMLETFNSDEGNEVVTYQDLVKLDYGVPYHVNDKVMFIRQLTNNPDELLFHTYMKPGGVFGKQSHDVLEQCEVIKGKLIEAMRDDKIYLEGETVTYDKFEVHKPYTDEISIYHVSFKRETNITSSRT